jgi:hypothetical protein
MRLPATTYRHGHNQDRRGNNTGVSPDCFTAYPVMGGESRHCTHLTVHYLSPVTLEGGYDKARIPQSRDSALSLRPRPGLDAQYSSTRKEGRYGTALRVISSTHPLRHGTQGWPTTPGHVATVTSTRIDKTSPQGSRRLGLPSPYKKGRPGLYNGQRTTSNKPHTSQKPSSDSLKELLNRDQHLKQSPLYLFSS